MDRRIFGLENEYGVTCTFRGQRRLSPDEVARYLFRRVVSWGRSSNVFLSNGARLYLDVGSHPEYATPECDSLIDLVVHDKAGERILEGLLVDAERRLREEGIAGDVYLFKNNTDSAGNSYGCHENYLVARHGEFSRLADVLIPFLVTRQIICGAGKVLQTPRGATYCVSQRAEHIWEGVSSATTRSRPIINTRDEPHADAERYRRLHVIVGDSNMSETTTLLKVGATDLVLRMIEAGVVMRDLTLENPIRAIREVSHDMTGRRTVRLANGREASALDIQEEYLTKARDFASRRGLDDGLVKTVLDLWERTLHAVSTGDLDLVGREIDWVIKYQLIDRYSAKHDLRPVLAAHRAPRPRLPRHPPQPRAVLPAREGRPGRPRGARPRTRSSRRRCRRRRPGPGCAGSSSAGRRRSGATSPWTGCTSSSTTRPAHGAVQGPVPVGRRAGRQAHREHVIAYVGEGRAGSGLGWTGTPRRQLPEVYSCAAVPLPCSARPCSARHCC
jgi:proteasome accessory factor A